MMYSSWADGVGFVPGDAVGMVGDRTIALIEADPRSDLVKGLWDGVMSGAELDDIADELARAGLRSLPSLAVVQMDGPGCRAIVRGQIMVTLRRPATPVDTVLDGSTVSTWVEHTEPEVVQLEMHLRGDLSETGAFLVDRGVVPACRLVWAPASSDESVAAPPLMVGEAPASEQMSDVSGAAESPEAPAGGLASDAVADAAADVGLPVVAPSVSDGDPDQGQHDGPVGGADDGPDHMVDPAHANATMQFDTSDVEELAPLVADEPVQPALDPADNELTVIVGPEDSAEFDHLFAATQFRSVADAGRSEVEDPHVVDEADGLISSTPSSVADAGQDLPAVDGDHDGMTVSLAQLRAAGAIPGASSGPSNDASVIAEMVHAVECPSRHYNPPNATTCRVCGLEIPAQAHMSVPRPVLGTFRFSTGEDRPVTRSMLMGRSPKSEGPVGGELPELVSLPSPRKELSGTHLEVRLEGWQVLVVDRQSTNGTSVRLPGRDPQRLHPGEPFQIVPGAVVDMADEVSFTYEAST